VDAVEGLTTGYDLGIETKEKVFNSEISNWLSSNTLRKLEEVHMIT
jgi:hypothetical protein